MKKRKDKYLVPIFWTIISMISAYEGGMNSILLFMATLVIWVYEFRFIEYEKRRGK